MNLTDSQLPRMPVIESLSIVWIISALVLDIIGNGFVIFATKYYHAIKLDKLSVWIVQMLAVADIGNGITLLIPIAVVLFCNGWVFGLMFCKISYSYKYFFVVANIFLINFLSLNKMFRCVAPLRQRTARTDLQKRGILVVTLVASGALPLYSIYTTFLRDYREVKFSMAQCLCWSGYTEGAPRADAIIVLMLSWLLNAIPCLLLVATNTFLTVFALVKAKSKVNKMNIVIVVIVTITFLFSVLPYFIYYMVYGDTWNDFTITRLVTFTTFLSTFSNPIVYFLTNATFRRFTVRFVRCSSKVDALNTHAMQHSSFARQQSTVRRITVMPGLSSYDRSLSSKTEL